MVTVSKSPLQISGASWSERLVGLGLWGCLVGMTGGTHGWVGLRGGLVVVVVAEVVVGSGSGVVV